MRRDNKMDIQKAEAKIAALTAPREQDVGHLFLKLGLELVACGDKSKIRRQGREIGQIDFIFQDRHLEKVFLTEVSTDTSDISQKMNHFFSRWSDPVNMNRIRTQFNLPRAYKMIRIFFQLAGKQEVPPSVMHSLSVENHVLFKYDFNYFADALGKVMKWARNDFLSYLEIKPKRLTSQDKPAIQFYLDDDNIAYVYVDTAKSLLQYCYISRRKKDDKGYQRMLEKGRIGSIARKIQNSSIFAFPNSILISCPDAFQLCANPAQRSDCPSSVTIKVPNYYSACRVIDGQHRLLAFANLDDRYQEDHSIPVVALENIKKHREMRTFIEINSGQKKIDRNLILVLTADFDWDIKLNSKEFFEKQAVLVVKKLNETQGSPLKDKVFIPEALAKKKGKITLTTMVTAILGNNFIGKRHRLFQKSYTDTNTPYRRIREIFVLAKQKLPRYCQDTSSFLLTNKGLRVLFRVVQIFERNRKKKQVNCKISSLFSDLSCVFDNKFVESLEDYYGEGGANRAVEEIYKKLKKSNKHRYKQVVTDLRLI